MTEAEWLGSTRPRTLLNFMRGRVSSRKLRLFACACCRDFQWVTRDAGLTRLVSVMEEFADGVVEPAELPRFGFGTDHWSRVIYGIKSRDEFSAACKVLKDLGAFGTSPFADVFRDIVGNPFRPVALTASWLTSDVTALAQSIYADRAFDRLAILADALMDAGCDNADTLTHCRGDGPHARGCWVVDMLLGKA